MAPAGVSTGRAVVAAAVAAQMPVVRSECMVVPVPVVPPCMPVPMPVAEVGCVARCSAVPGTASFTPSQACGSGSRQEQPLGWAGRGRRGAGFWPAGGRHRHRHPRQAHLAGLAGHLLTHTLAGTGGAHAGGARAGGAHAGGAHAGGAHAGGAGACKRRVGRVRWSLAQWGAVLVSAGAAAAGLGPSPAACAAAPPGPGQCQAQSSCLAASPPVVALLACSSSLLEYSRLLLMAAARQWSGNTVGGVGLWRWEIGVRDEMGVAPPLDPVGAPARRRPAGQLPYNAFRLGIASVWGD